MGELYKKYPVMCTLWAFMEVMLFAGMLFGWGSLVYILKEEGFYRDLCSNEKTITPGGSDLTVQNDSFVEFIYDVKHDANGSVPDIENSTSKRPMDTRQIGCPAQESQLNLWFSIALSFTYLSFSGIGYMIRNAGVRFTRIIFLIVYFSGMMCLGFATPELPWLILPGLCCIGTSGLVVLGTNLQVADLHPHVRSTIVAIFTGLFHFSSVLKQLVRVAYENGIARRTSYIAIACLIILMVSISTLCFLPKMRIDECHVNEIKRRRRLAHANVINKLEDNYTSTAVDDANYTSTAADDANCGSTEADDADKSGVYQRETNETLLDDPLRAHPNGGSDVVQGAEMVESNISKPGLASSLSKPGLASSLLSLTFILHLSWLFVHALRFVTFIGLVNVWLENVFQDKQKVGEMLAVFSYMTLGSILTSLLCGFIYDYMRTKLFAASKLKRTYVPVVLPMCLVIVFSMTATIMCLIKHAVTPYLAFIAVTFFRSSMWTVAVAFAGDAFPLDHFGVLFGFIQFSAGIAGLIQYPIFQWYDAYENSSDHVNILLLVLQVITFIHPVILYIRGTRDVTQTTSMVHSQRSSLLMNLRQPKNVH